MNLTRKLTPLLLAAALAYAVLAAPASAGQYVYGSGDDIRVVNDDGSGDRVLVPESAIPGAESLYGPWVAPGGDTVLFQARVPHPGMGGLYCGFNCVAIYALQDGQLARLTGNSTDCAGDLCAGLNVDPRLGPDGTLYYQLIYAEPNSSGTFNTISTEYFKPAGQAEQELPEGECGSTDDSAEPNPVVGGEYAISNYCVGGDGYTLLVQNTTGASEKRVFDDAAFSNIVWRPDGQLLASAESGGDAGIWTYPRTGGEPKQVVAVTYTDDQSAYETELAFAGASKLAFVWNDAIRTVSTDCTSCSVDSAATVLQSTDVDGLAWTGKSIPGMAVDNGGPGTGGPGTGGPGTGAPGTGGPGGGGDAGATLGTIAGAKLATALKRGIKVPFTAPSKGTLKLTAKVSGKVAKKLKLAKSAKKAVVVARATADVAGAGNATAKLKFTKVAKKRLKKAKSVSLAVGGTFAGAALPAASLKLRR